MNKKRSAKLALCGIFAALAVGLLFLGGVVPFAAIACPVLASLVLLPVYTETGAKWGLLWYLAVSLLSFFLAPNKEAAVLFAAFGYYPMLHSLFRRWKSKLLQWCVKLLYLNAVTVAAYSLMLFVLGIASVIEDFAGMKTLTLALLLLLANGSFVIYDLLLDRLELFYHVRLRPKLKL